MSEFKFHLPDMSCGHCVATVTRAVQALDPAAGVEIEREPRLLRVNSVRSRDELARALEEAGYPPEAAQ